MMRRCTKCLYPETAPGISFDEQGVCSGCRNHERRKLIDWDAKKEELLKIADKYRKKSGYDCIIGISGGKDSHYQTYYAKEMLELHPLLVTFNHLDNSETGIRNLENLIVKFGVDHIRVTPNPDVIRRSCRWSLKKLGELLWHEHAGIYTTPLRYAVLHDIKLIIWGEYGFNDLTGLGGELPVVTKDMVVKYGMRGHTAETFLEDNDEELTLRDFQFAQFPKESKMKELNSLFLGNYIDWDPVSQTEFMINNYGLYTEERQATFNPYENSETYFNDSIHDYGKFIRYGYNRAVDHASQLIRAGYINRDEGAYLANKYMPRMGESHELFFRLDQFLNDIGYSFTDFYELTSQKRHPKRDIEGILYNNKNVDKKRLKDFFYENKIKKRKGRIYV